MFQLSRKQWESLKSQNATSSWGGRRTVPNVFTEQGVAMLSSVLNSSVAINVNIQIIRVFTKMREMLLPHKDRLLEMEEIRKKVTGQDEKIELIFNYLKQFIKDQEEPRKAIGYKNAFRKGRLTLNYSINQHPSKNQTREKRCSCSAALILHTHSLWLSLIPVLRLVQMLRNPISTYGGTKDRRMLRCA